MKKTIFTLITILISFNLFAVAAFSFDREFKNTDGTSFIGRVVGDEHLNYVVDKNKLIVVYNNESGNYEYGEIVDDNLVASGIKQGNPNNLDLPIITSKDLIMVRKNK
jgi:hypothetical protein